MAAKGPRTVFNFALIALGIFFMVSAAVGAGYLIWTIGGQYLACAAAAHLSCTVSGYVYPAAWTSGFVYWVILPQIAAQGLLATFLTATDAGTKLLVATTSGIIVGVVGFLIAYLGWTK